MWASIAFVALLIAIAVVLATQDLFSALVQAVLTICCAALAFGTHEWVASHWLAPHWRPNYALAIALAATFGIPLIILRLAMDKLVRRACLLPTWIERVGGGLCGVITAFTMVGVTAHAAQMLPFDRTFLGFSRIADPSENSNVGGADSSGGDSKTEEQDLLLKPDRFAVALASRLSAGVFSGGRVFSEVYPDKVQAVGWVNAVPGILSRYAPPGSISVVRTQPVPFLYCYTRGDNRRDVPGSYEPLAPPKGGYEFQMVRLQLRREARDARRSHLFTLRQFRLVGREQGEEDYVQFHPIALQQEDVSETTNRHFRTLRVDRGERPIVDDLYEPRDGNEAQVEVVFELPKRFVPSFIEYKSLARAELRSFAAAAPQAPAPAPAPEAGSDTSTSSTPAAPATPAVANMEQPPSAAVDSTPPPRGRRRSRRPRRGETSPDSGRGGNVRGFTTRVSQSSFGDDLPLTMQSYQQLNNVEITAQKLVNGHLFGFVDAQGAGTDQPIAKFEVPADKRLLHLNVKRLEARSGIGKAISFASKVVQNYVVEDSSGDQHKIIGKYAVAAVDGREAIEVQYFKDQAGTVGGLGQFSRLTDDRLKGDYEVILLFLVEPGVTITSFSTGGSATRRDDLSAENLVAPQ